jgi:DNA repair and recombination protein RAD54B
VQTRIFAEILDPQNLNSLIAGSTARSLALITKLTKISNSPTLVKPSKEEENDSRRLTDDHESEVHIDDALQTYASKPSELGDVSSSGE